MKGGIFMKKNVGTYDRIVRMILGILLLSLLIFLDGKIRLIGLLGIIPIITAFIKFCPLYAIFRIDTNQNK